MNPPGSERLELSERDVMRAFCRVSAELTKSVKNDFIEFAQRVLHVPSKASTASAKRSPIVKDRPQKFTVRSLRSSGNSVSDGFPRRQVRSSYRVTRQSGLGWV